MPRRRALRLTLIGVAAVLVLALVATIAIVGTVIRRPLPAHAGTVDVPGLQAEVTVHRDGRGVPHLFADTPEDLFLAQGYVHAQDRFFEMDYRRHVTAGRLSELVGVSDEALSADKVIRTFGWRAVAEQEWDLLAEDTRSYLEAYARGVNAYLRDKGVEQLGVEYAVLGTQVRLEAPEPWDPVDSLAWLKAMAWDLRGNYDRELSRASTYATLRDVELVEQLFPRFPEDRHAPVLPADQEPGAQGEAEEVAAPADDDVAAPARPLALGTDLQDALRRVQEALDAVPRLLGEGEGIGSNSWAVAGEHTASGSPVLANDPHLSISAPGIFSQVGLHCRAVDDDCPFSVSGFSFAGFPGVIIGRNAELAWGLTNLGADATDFFLHRTDPSAGTYTRAGEQVPFETRTEVIEVNGGDSVELEIRQTVHGPIVSDVLGIARVTNAPTADGLRRATEIALGWTALEPGRTADAVFLFATASGPEDIAAAAEAFEVPSQNIVYATADGTIGYQAPGRIPVRDTVADGPVPADGTWPRPGWDPRYDWQGWVEPADMPAAVNPPEGFIVAANQAVTPSGTGPFLTRDWDYGYRSERIRSLLTEQIDAGLPVDIDTTVWLQADSWSPHADLLVPYLLDVPVEDAFVRDAVDLLRDWDGRTGTDSAAAAYFAAVWATLLELTFWDDLPEEQWPSGDSRWLAVVENLLEEPDSPWWDDRRTVNVVESRDEILARSLDTARLRMTVALGKHPRDWRWDRLHVAAPQHPVLGGDGLPEPVRMLANPSPLGVPGGSSIVNATAWDAASGSFEVTAAPAMRMVVDLADPDAATWVTLTGTSGHPGSAHYTDQFATWAEGGTFDWPFTEEAVEEASSRRLTLRPPAG